MAARTIVWFRRDLRVEDNPALVAAARAGIVIPVFIWSPEEDGQFHPGRVSRWWLKQSLIHLDASLKSLGSPLIMRKSPDTLTVLLDIVQQVGATQVFYNHLYDPVSLVRDHRVKQGLSIHNIPVHTFNGDLLYEPWEVYDDEGQAFTTFDDFWDKCMNMPFEPEAPLLSPRRLVGLPPGRISAGRIDDLGLENEYERSSNALLGRAWAPGWSSANKALEVFMKGPLHDYATHRIKADNANTSQLSPHLHFGEVSVRKIFHEARTKQILWARENSYVGEQSVGMFLRAIGFREYSRYLSFNFPFTHERSLLANLKSFPWRIDENSFKSWRQGRTGYPLVDAGMRELWATGWLHNRIRVVVSSFCVKFLQLPWRWGMKYFWDTLLDADLECDVLGWQYISGSLPDGHELDRMENPQIEGYKFDPEGEYVRRWLPELSRLPTEWIHHPWDAPANVLRAAGVELGSNYPRPIVDISSARDQLQQSLAEMWEREAASKAALANGSEEGLGETVETPGSCGPGVKMDVHRVVIRSSRAACSTASSRRDQLVPCMPTEDHKLAAASIMNWNQSPVDEEDEPVQPAFVPSQTGGLLDRPSEVRAEVIAHPPSDSSMAEAVHVDNELNSTAESSAAVGRRSEESRGEVPVWPHSSSSRPQRPHLEGLVPVVPEVRRATLNRRHLHSMQMVNLEARTSHKADDVDLPAAKRFKIKSSKREPRIHR
ncbi:deoxyribodipyrimidine photo-lyase [Marchantia polymorpha subsp. ruderalis]|uniref:Photolyase/cryptochrome alpha/beta domain-containing protein n=1 Tax=Marchantia polymorpha TaxID=3197 RepID=A0A2R6WG70_MARPO|nr:hypothetical protein MARPO_0094s0027 [Marchantia polymorpha]BBN02726.1 hypothetical protein Mp_2g17590 [Marchantia polymorpha subsp. ruderalis]|eukprot:PTQ32850.1 hypothetical protein MARPO_0094s0027 [Marchantia polymorpha]